MTDARELAERNARFAAERFEPDLSINPQGGIRIIGCIDTRVDPTYILGLKQGEASVIRNVGGRITPTTIHTLQMLAKVGQANPDRQPPGDRSLVILHHTDCGMTDLAAHPDLLIKYFEITLDELEAKAVSDPYRSVKVDVDIIRTALAGSGILVSGMVYDVLTGLVQTVAPAQRI